eukprot:CAMPEP_0118660782 /NCGR_PEP_ID=MMETSP0785-20121206/15891_1 /TAXON_ID=91992 /ORGANISM="Bolidomonas pacifica, Strain CCMP 1866" /LENGTH=198 /DNA_ID=CAMNT_0006554101 /DNA_START=1 /DNA_END=594 /DNA_ORIENTATION=+
MAINYITEHAGSSKGGNYSCHINTSGDGRASGEIRRGQFMNLFCCGLYSACFCPYNVWGIKLWVDQGSKLKWELSKKTNTCIQCCFSGLCGVMILGQQYLNIRRTVNSAMTAMMQAIAARRSERPASALNSNSFAPSAPPPTFSTNTFEPPKAEAIRVDDANVIPIVTAYVVEDASAPTYEACPSYTDSLAHDQWLKQ